MAKITAGVATSHVPAIGAAMDLGKTQDAYWVPLFKGYEFSKQWMKSNTPDVVFLVYNDHATAFSLDFIPTSRFDDRSLRSTPGKDFESTPCTHSSRACENAGTRPRRLDGIVGLAKSLTRARFTRV